MAEGTAAVDTAQTRSAAVRLGDLWRRRALIVNLVRRELRARYKGSVVGFAWSLLNPAMYLAVFSVVFTELLRVQVPLFGVFLLCGLLVWNFFSSSVTAAGASLLDNASLVQKVWFPREALPIASVGAGLVNLCLQASVLLFGMILFRNWPDPRALPLLLPAMLALVLITTGMSLLISALTVRFRDVKHLMEVALTGWFWMSAVVYPYAAVADRLGRWEWLAMLNPIIPIVLTFQRVLYNPPAVTDDGIVVLPNLDPMWFLTRLGSSLAFGVVLCVVGFRVFARREADFGDQL